MRVEKNPKNLQKTLSEIRKTKSLGFVPTMGALHTGHLSLIKKAKLENSFVVVSLFVNPTQFDDPKDFKNYPVQKEQDLALLKQHNVDLVFCPDEKSLYPDHYSYRVTERNFSEKLCGRKRPGHFTGVLTIVLKLLNLVRPTKIYFGEKDYQQLQLIRKMAEAFFIPTEVTGCPTLRDKEGLALSSRNQRLSQSGLEKARAFSKILKNFREIKEVKQQLRFLGVEIDYVEDTTDRRFAAIKIENVRLIDNVRL